MENNNKTFKSSEELDSIVESIFENLNVGTVGSIKLHEALLSFYFLKAICSSDKYSFLIPNDINFDELNNEDFSKGDFFSLICDICESIQKYNPLINDVFSPLKSFLNSTKSYEKSHHIFKFKVFAFKGIDNLVSDWSDSLEVSEIFKYLIDRFIRLEGKVGKSGVPVNVGRLMSSIIDLNMPSNIYDPFCNVGNTLVELSEKNRKTPLMGRDSNFHTSQIALMNCILSGADNVTISHEPFFSDLSKEKHIDDLRFNLIATVPPFSERLNQDLIVDESYLKWGRPPKAKADFAYISAMLSLLDEGGQLVVIVPHGVLFRGGSEQVIRKNIIKDNLLDAVISLPPNLFPGSSIGTVLLVFKNKRHFTDIVFIDASKEYESTKNYNFLSDSTIEKISNSFKHRETINGYSRCINIEEVKCNDYNLNVPRYVDTFKEKETVDVVEELEMIESIRYELEFLGQEMDKLVSEVRNGISG